MSNVIKFPVIAGVEITTDDEGRFNLNALHRASGSQHTKRPSIWLATKQAQELALELSQNSGLGQEVINSMKGGIAPGTFAHELLAISYAGWISPAFQLKVNQVFLDYRTGKLAPIEASKEHTRLEILQMAMEAEQERMRLAKRVEEDAPKVEFFDRVACSEDAISVGEAAKVIGTGRKRLFAFLREIGWLTRYNEPYQSKIDSGYMDVKLGGFQHPDHGFQQSVTPLITGKGLTKLEKLYRERRVSSELMHQQSGAIPRI